MKVLKFNQKVKRQRKSSKTQSLKFLKHKKPWVSSILKNLPLSNHSLNHQIKSHNWVSPFFTWNLQAQKTKKVDGMKSEEWSPIHHHLSTLWSNSVSVLVKWQVDRSKLSLIELITRLSNLTECSKSQNQLTTCFYGLRLWSNCILFINKLNPWKRQWRKWRRRQNRWPFNLKTQTTWWKNLQNNWLKQMRTRERNKKDWMSCKQMPGTWRENWMLLRNFCLV